MHRCQADVNECIRNRDASFVPPSLENVVNRPEVSCVRISAMPGSMRPDSISGGSSRNAHPWRIHGQKPATTPVAAFIAQQVQGCSRSISLRGSWEGTSGMEASNCLRLVFH